MVIQALPDRAAAAQASAWDHEYQLATGADFIGASPCQQVSAAALAAARRAMRLDTRLLGTASHDLRQPLQAIALWVELLRERIDDPEVCRILAKIHSTAQGAERLLDTLLDISRLDLGVIAPKPVDFHAGVLLDHLCATFAPAAVRSRLKLRVRSSDSIARSDPVLLERVLSNFVSNAIRNTKQGGVLVGCRRRSGHLCFEVWDTGSGIPAERLPDIFDEFVQLGAVGGRPHGGVGLGLSIANRTAELLGHRIRVRSRVGSGSCFRIDVPCGEALHPAACDTPADDAAGIYGAFVVFVEDDAQQRDAMEQLLQRWGCHTLTASSGAGAVTQLSDHLRAPNLLLCDYRLAHHETGMDAIRALRAAIGDEVPAIVISGEPHAFVDPELHASGIPLLRKPVAAEQLRLRLAELLSPKGRPAA